MHIPVSRRLRPRGAGAVAATAHLDPAPRPARKPAGGFELTVDSIMRGPKLVGYPPTGLRWSGDSSRLYFEWRRPGDDEASTWVVARDGGAPRKLTDDERRSAPPVDGRWDAAHRRVLFVDRGDIVLLDSVAGTRRQITRTTGNESEPAVGAARNGRHLHRATTTCSSCRSTAASCIAAHRRAAEKARSARDRQPEVRQGRRAEADRAHARRGGEEEEDRGEGQGARAAEVRARRSPDGDRPAAVARRHARLRPVVERAETAKRPNVPNYVTESSYTEDIPARTFVGDAQDKRTLAVMNLETGKTRERMPASPARFRSSDGARTARTQPTRGPLGHAAAVRRRRASRSRTCAPTTTRIAGWSPSIPSRARPACSTRCTTTPGCARSAASARTIRRSAGCRIRTHVWFLSERDGWMHLYSVDATADRAGRAQLTAGQVGDRRRSACRPTSKKFYITSTEVHPGERHIYAMPVDGGARTKLTSMTGGSAGEVVARRQHVRARSTRPAPSRTRST